MIFVALLFVITFLIFSPKVFLLSYLVIRYYAKPVNYNNIKVYEFIIFLYLSICLSIMLANRPYYLGKDIGFGDDMLHYYNAFEWIVSNSFYEFFTNFSVITNLTGSAEPLFWLVIKIISVVFQDPYYIHVSLTVLGCLLIYLAGQVWNKCGLLFLFFYTNTITFFAFQGSAVRSGLAFSFALLGYVYFLKNNKKWFQLIAPLVHFSMIPFPIVSYISASDFNDTKKKIKLFIFLSLFLSLFSIVAINSIDMGLGAKLTARVSENELDVNSLIQFLFESLFTVFLTFFIFRNKVDKRLKSSLAIFLFFAICLLFVSPTAFSRFYRYEYILFILIYSSIFMKSTKPIKLILLVSSFSWFVFIGFDRFIGVFAEDIFEYIHYNLFM